MLWPDDVFTDGICARINDGEPPRVHIVIHKDLDDYSQDRPLWLAEVWLCVCVCLPCFRKVIRGNQKEGHRFERPSTLTHAQNELPDFTAHMGELESRRTCQNAWRENKKWDTTNPG